MEITSKGENKIACSWSVTPKGNWAGFLCVRSMYLEASKKPKQWITFKVSEQEMSALETYCKQTQRTKTDVLRGLLRELPTYSNSSDSFSS